MVSRDDVIACYKYILGRTPENEDVIASRLGVNTLSELRLEFVNSPELLLNLKRWRVLATYIPPLVWPANKVDCEASAAQLDFLFDRIRREWDDLGRSEPHWSVLTQDKYKRDALDGGTEEFFASGELVANIVAAFFQRHGLDMGKMATCFELGCGVGRMTLHLSRLFSRVIAADISQSHLAACAKELGSRGVNNVELVCLDSPVRLTELQEIQFFCSIIVLQHNPPPVMTYLLDVILGKLVSGGVAIFQVPTWRNGYHFDLAEYLNKPVPQVMEMHTLPQDQVFKILARNACRVVEVREDGWAEGRSAESLSNTFFVIKE